MLLTQKDIDELKEIYRLEYHKELPDNEAWEMGHRLLRIFGILTGVSYLPDTDPEGVRTASNLTK